MILMFEMSENFSQFFSSGLAELLSSTLLDILL